MESVLTLLCTLAIFAAVPGGTPDSPQITLEIRDVDGTAMGGAKASFRHWREKKKTLATANADEKGRLTCAVPLPKSRPTTVSIEVSHEGFRTHTTSNLLVPQTQRTMEIVLEKEQKTTLRFFEYDGRKAAHRPFVIDWDCHYQTDRDGEFVLYHAEKPERSSEIRFFNQAFQLNRVGGVQEIRPEKRQIVDLYNIQLQVLGQQEKPPPIRPLANLRGRLLSPDGTPARDWVVATRVQRTGGWMSINDYSTQTYSYEYDQLAKVDGDGRFHFDAAGNDLVLFSPDGMPLRYPLNPDAWAPDEFDRQIEITVPAIRHVKWELRYDESDGPPAANVEIAPNQFGDFYDKWMVHPRDEWRHYAQFDSGRFPSPRLADLIDRPQSNAKGEVHIPTHPMRSVAYQWRSDPESSHWRWFGRDDGKIENGVVVIKRKEDPSSVPQYRRINCSFRSSSGRKVEPAEVYWEAYSGASRSLYGRDGFLDKAKNKGTVTLGKWNDRVEFSYLTKSGRTEYFTHLIDPREDPMDLDLDVRLTKKKPYSVAGRVRSHKGDPMEGATLHLFRQKDKHNRDYLHLKATTDKNGRFHFPYAPAGVSIRMTTEWESRTIELDHLTGAPTIPGDHGNLDIRLNPSGSVRIEIAEAKLLPGSVTLLPLSKGPDETQTRVPSSPDDPAVFFNPFVPTGKYRATYAYGAFEIPDSTISVKAGKLNELKLLGDKNMREPPPDPKKETRIPVTVVVTRNGRPISGVVVKSRRQDAEKPTRQVRINPVSHAHDYIGDLTDREGRARFLAEPGSLWFFAALDHEKRISWGLLEVGKQPKELKLSLRPLETAVPERPEKKHYEKPLRGGKLACQMHGIYAPSTN